MATKTKKKDRASKSKRTLAEKADKYKCYQASVQSPDHEVEFFIRAYREHFDRQPLTLREDFCGTFAVCCEWVKTHAERTAIAVDLDDEPLEWGKANNLVLLNDEEQKRIRILQQDVRKRNRPQVDVLAAQNFSFWIFKTRSEVIEYFKVARANMAAQSIMVMDMMGGGQCYEEDHTDVRTIKKGKKGFKYYWKQDRFNPITADARFYIGFKFADGSRIKKAFEYNWRFWSIPEVREMLSEAGFSSSHVYWEMEKEGQEAQWQMQEEAESDPSWICYIVAIK
ncbi:MAG: hypothetical protein AAGA30_07355 [Planctomycetota bacterium]